MPFQNSRRVEGVEANRLTVLRTFFDCFRTLGESKALKQYLAQFANPIVVFQNSRRVEGVEARAGRERRVKG